MRGAKRYEDLIVWQLADQIRVLVFKLTQRECFARDLKLHSQTEDAVNSVCRNIAEGFGCKHKEFARFLEISRRSLNELGDSFRAAQLKRYVTAHDYEPIWRLTQRLYPAFARFIRYLQTTPDPDCTKTMPARTDRNPARTDRDPARTSR
jgi:four helix bundle protein